MSTTEQLFFLLFYPNVRRGGGDKRESRPNRNLNVRELQGLSGTIHTRTIQETYLNYTTVTENEISVHMLSVINV